MQMVAADIMGQLQRRKNGNHYFLVILPVGISLCNQVAIAVANKLVDNMFCCYSVPEEFFLILEHSLNHKTEVMKQVCM